MLAGLMRSARLLSNLSAQVSFHRTEGDRNTLIVTRPFSSRRAMRPVPALSQQTSFLASAPRSCRTTTMQASRQPATLVVAAAAAAGRGGGSEPAAPQAQQPQGLRTCRRCKQQFDPAVNGPTSCRYHSALWTGGEISKASCVPLNDHHAVRFRGHPLARPCSPPVHTKPSLDHAGHRLLPAE